MDTGLVSVEPTGIFSTAFQEIYVKASLINHLFISVCHSESAYSVGGQGDSSLFSLHSGGDTPRQNTSHTGGIIPWQAAAQIHRRGHKESKHEAPALVEVRTSSLTVSPSLFLEC